MSMAAPPQRHHTFWCHECDMSVFLPLHLHNPPPTNPHCPHCHSDFLEHMDSITPPPIFPNHPNPNPTTFTPSDDNFLLNSPYLHRLIHHLTTTNHAPVGPTPTTDNPASISAISSLELVKITSSMLKNDPVIPCPVCKDNFLLDMEVKMLPCKHMYHEDCILPWLDINNSCPVCRFKLPTEEDEVNCHRRRDFIELQELLSEQEDMFGFRRTLRRVSRRHQLDRENVDGDTTEFLLSPTQIGEAGGQGGVGGVVGRENSVETVSSWPNWAVESVSDDEVGGGEGDTVVRS
ncbi:uncharacterized protein LOC132636059 isoform X1 [Lycium barbarum]|uniref:uncharacterized protein LOC132636059 isoform X1 n=1 Tax=Lycium barbarum TaxID=112863 RepID=UPI00293EB8DF|nr:uncharacterized protein LOC132636059 isoform X1 [Lycium barbarum]XP_060208719.1 uncharacterized protein LOC132636059 isoform X1 [Lycium barbarum]